MDPAEPVTQDTRTPAMRAQAEPSEGRAVKSTTFPIPAPGYTITENGPGWINENNITKDEQAPSSVSFAHCTR